MLTVACCLWDSNRHTYKNSRVGFNEDWVEKLYRGFSRNLTRPFQFICFTERERKFLDDIQQARLSDPEPHCGSLVEPYRLGVPMILVGLDTVIVGNIDHIADYALTADKLALTRDPYAPERACTGVAVVPAGHQFVWDTYDGGRDDMVHMRKQPHVYVDDLWPGQVRSYKVHVAGRGWLESRIVYFHGAPKMNHIPNEDFIRRHWR